MAAFSMVEARRRALRESWALRAFPVARSGWERRAACRGVQDLFSIEEVGAEAVRSIAAAVAVCEGCPVRLECLQQAMFEEQRQADRFGVRGGFSAAERRRLGREQRRRAAAA